MNKETKTDWVDNEYNKTDDATKTQFRFNCKQSDFLQEELLTKVFVERGHSSLLTYPTVPIILIILAFNGIEISSCNRTI